MPTIDIKTTLTYNLSNFQQSTIMKEELEQIRNQQKNAWNEFSAGWKKWNDVTMDFKIGEQFVMKKIKLRRLQISFVH